MVNPYKRRATKRVVRKDAVRPDSTSLARLLCCAPNPPSRTLVPCFSRAD